MGVVGSGSGLAGSARLDRKFTVVGLDRDGINHTLLTTPTVPTVPTVPTIPTIPTVPTVPRVPTIRTVPAVPTKNP